MPGTRGCHDGKLTGPGPRFALAGEIPGKHRARVPGCLSGPLRAWRGALRAAIEARSQGDDTPAGRYASTACSLSATRSPDLT